MRWSTAEIEIVLIVPLGLLLEGLNARSPLTTEYDTPLVVLL